MMRLHLLALTILLLFSVLIIGCGSQAGETEEPEATIETAAETAALPPTATSTPNPSPTSEPSDTPEPAPTETPKPTDTPEPTPTQEPELFVLVTDIESGDPIVGASVELTHNGSALVHKIESNDEGEVRFSSLQTGDFTLTVTAAGYYDEIDEEVVVTGPADTTSSMIQLAMAEIIVESAILHAGPGSVYSREGEITEGQAVEIINQNEDGDWFLVALGEEDETAWVAGEDVSVSGGIDLVEVVEAPPTPTPAPTSAPAATEEPEDTETADTMVFYYISNPNEILGVFPVRPFDPVQALSKMQVIGGALYTMRDALPGARAGDAAACSSYTSAYNNVLYSGVFYDPVPPEWEDIDGIYYLSFLYALDRTRPSYLSCDGAGRVDDFNAGLAEESINQTLSFLEPGINEAAARQ